MKRERITMELPEESAKWLHEQAKKLKIHPEIIVDAMIRDQQSFKTFDDYLEKKDEKR